MKFAKALSFLVAMSTVGLAVAQHAVMHDSDMSRCHGTEGTGVHQCREMMNSGEMNDAGKPVQGKVESTVTHLANAQVWSIYPATGTVTLAHGPVKTLNWPAGKTTFKTSSKTVFDKLAMRRDVVVEFVQQDSEYVITSVR